MSAVLTIEKVNKKYPDGFHAVRDVSFSVEQGETLCLLGTSGCGKTTLLKMINRLIEPTSGSIYLRGRDTREWNVTLLRRGIGYVIQSIGLFPHMKIKDNVALVPRLCGWDEKAIKERVRELMEMVHLEPEKFLERYPCELSGGQQQRVGVIRALAVDPDVILMDEPFGALDPITRSRIQEEFIQLRRNLGKTILIVTHDLSEAVKLGDRIALIHQGSIEQLDTPQQLIQNPASEFVRSFFSRHQSQKFPSALCASDIAIAGVGAGVGAGAGATAGAGTTAGAGAGASSSGFGLEINGSVSAREAVSLYLGSGGKVITVLDDEGISLGVINEEAIVRVFSLTFWEDISRA
ncbi:MAG: ABC transporter ATP-binding protein [Vulcanimicrobiota bacterium]